MYSLFLYKLQHNILQYFTSIQYNIKMCKLLKIWETLK